MSNCSVCGRTLKEHESVTNGVGPKCAAKFYMSVPIVFHDISGQDAWNLGTEIYPHTEGGSDDTIKILRAMRNRKGRVVIMNEVGERLEELDQDEL